MTNEERAAKLRQAAVLVHEANCLMQEALGDYDTGECYELHNACESLVEDFEGWAASFS